MSPTPLTLPCRWSPNPNPQFDAQCHGVLQLVSLQVRNEMVGWDLLYALIFAPALASIRGLQAFSHIRWMGINTLRIGPLLCPDNVGMLIFESRYYFFFRLLLFLSFLLFLHLSIIELILGLTRIVYYDGRGSLLFAPTLKEIQVSARSTKATRLTLQVFRGVQIPNSIVHPWAIS